MKIKVKKYSKNLFAILKKPEMSILPANIAFYFMLALIPVFTLLLLLLSSFSISTDVIVDLVENIFPEGISETVVGLITLENFNPHLNIFIIIAFIVATNGTNAIVVSSNELYKHKSNSFAKNRIKAIILLIIILILLLFLIMVPILGRQILELLKNIKTIEKIIPNLIFVYSIIKWPVTFLIIYFNLKLIYAISTSVQEDNIDTTEGAFFTTICWVIATALFSYYVNNFARYDLVYGNLSTLIILMFWIYALSYIFVKYNNDKK